MLALSVVVPFFHKLAELRAALPLNARYLAREDVEYVLVLDEPSEESAVLALLDEYPAIQARVIVNDEPHSWRTPSKAINVGIWKSRGQYVVVVSPESVFVDDVPTRLLHQLEQHPDHVVIGRVASATFEEASGGDLVQLFEKTVRGWNYAQAFYGSIAASRKLFESVHGWDEQLTKWGADDDNLRIRLGMIGANLILNAQIRLIHMSPERRLFGPPKGVPAASNRERLRICRPRAAVANPNGWGLSFGRVARDWAVSPPAETDSRSTGADLTSLSWGQTTRGGTRTPRVIAAFSFRYDSHLVDDLLTNLDPIVDGWVAFDDRRSTAVFSDERVRRQALIEKAKALGSSWILFVDPDERLERRLARTIDQITQPGSLIARSFRLRELYAPDRYRVDGLWGRKRVVRLFPLVEGMQVGGSAFHGPPVIGFEVQPTGFNLYHLKMITRERRRARSELYKLLDPENRFQRVGYDYLADETGAEFEMISPRRGYHPAHKDDGGLWMPEMAFPAERPAIKDALASEQPPLSDALRPRRDRTGAP